MPHAHHPHVVQLLEAAYRPSLAVGPWLAQLAQAAQAFDQGLGVLVAYERFGPAGRDRLGFESLGNPQLDTFLARLGEQANPVASVFATRMVSVGSLRAIAAPTAGAALDDYFAALAPLGIEDLWGIGVTHPESGLALVVCWPTRRVAEPQGFGLWARTAMHLAAALRLRGTLQQEGGIAPAAVLAPHGRVLHAEGLATHRDIRKRLVEGVRASERARTTADPERALSLWQALTAGRFSLVDRIESDGRRFILALPNELTTPTTLALSAREQAVVRWVVDGASNKEGAYALGLTLGGFSAQLTRALKKLRVANRTELKLLARRSERVPANEASAVVARHGFAALPLGASGHLPDEGALATLTANQRALVELIAEGLSNRAIGERLGISPHTVRNRVAALSEKLGGHTRSELVARLSVPWGKR